MGASFRLLYRLIGFCAIAVTCVLDFLLRIWLTGRAGDMRLRATWCCRWGNAFLRLLGVRLTMHGTPPSDGMMASNHLSYLDIVVYAACRPFVFVSKAEVKSWPIVGQMIRCAGTLFIQREQRSDVKRLAEAFAPIIRDGNPIVLFPEGTSTGGDRILPFHSSLFEPAAANQWSVSPAWIGYVVPGGDASEDVAYWKDMTFAPHLLHLFTLKEIHATVRFAPALPKGLSRKEIARQLHHTVCELARREGRTLVS
jgi:1-acyl-sn-glycerol-3-phosphate acyltransferase